MDKGLVFRKAEEKDLGKISNFRKLFPEVSVGVTQPAYYVWKFMKNPFEVGELWVAVDDGMVVGMKTATPKYMKVLDRKRLVCELGDSFTHPEYQRRGIFSTLTPTLRDSALEKNIGFMYHTPNANSRAAYAKKSEHGEIRFVQLHALVRPLKLSNALKNRFGNKGLLGPVAFALDFGVDCLFELANARIKNIPIVVSKVSTVPNDVNGFLDGVRESYDIMVERDKRYLEWRFLETSEKYMLFVARSESGEFLGYIVGKVVDMVSRKTGVIADFLTVDNQPDVFKKLVFRLLKEFKMRDVDTVKVWVVKNSLYAHIFGKFGFLRRRKIPVYCYKNALGEKIMMENCKWHFTMADTDNI